MVSCLGRVEVQRNKPGPCQEDEYTHKKFWTVHLLLAFEFSQFWDYLHVHIFVELLLNHRHTLHSHSQSKWFIKSLFSWIESITEWEIQIKPAILAHLQKWLPWADFIYFNFTQCRCVWRRSIVVLLVKNYDWRTITKIKSTNVLDRDREVKSKRSCE